MLILVRDEIQDYFNENHLPLLQYIINLIKRGSLTDSINVNFNFENTSVMTLENDSDLRSYLVSRHIDPDDLLVVSSILCDGFLKLIRGYYDDLENNITGKTDG
jgi:hypothetical protein